LAFAPPATVLVTIDDAHPVTNSLTLVVTNRSGAAVEFQNPEGLTPASKLPAWHDTASPLGRVSVWFPWGDAPGDLARVGDAQSIVAASVGPGWAASDRMTDPELGIYWTLFPLSKSVFLEQDASISFRFSGIVSHAGTRGTLPEQSWMTALPRVRGYSSDQRQVAIWKAELSARLTAPATAIPGDDVDLSWTSAGAEYCSLSPGGFDDLDPVGRQKVTMPWKPSVTYTLTAHPAIGRPVTDARTVTAETGWTDLGPFPGWRMLGGAFRTHSGFFAFDGAVVWTSADGRSWARGARLGNDLADPFAASDDGRLWVMGVEGGKAGNGDEPMTVASTTDGSSWTRHPAPPWRGIREAAATVFQGALWVLGGEHFPPAPAPAVRSTAVWCSHDGAASWSQAPPGPWPAGTELGTGQAAAFAGRLWIVRAGRDIWASPDGRAWTQEQPLPWSDPAFVYATAATDQALYAATWNFKEPANLLWRMDRAQSWSGLPVVDALSPEGPMLGLAPYGDGVLVLGPRAFRYVPPAG
jgi:hypothetical protein